MADGKIYITISDKRGGEGAGVPAKNEKKEKSQNELLMHYARQKIIDETKLLAKQALNFGISNIGNFTGNFQAQRDVQSAMSIVSSMANVGMSAWSGFKVAGVPGAIIGAGISVLNQGVGMVSNYVVGDLENKKLNYSIDILRKRSGLNGLYDGSRGTEQ